MGDVVDTIPYVNSNIRLDTVLTQELVSIQHSASVHVSLNEPSASAMSQFTALSSHTCILLLSDLHRYELTASAVSLAVVSKYLILS